MFHISCNQLSYIFSDGSTLFEELQFSWTGQRLGIVGDNGCGKSTLLHILGGSLPASSGSVDLGGSVTILRQKSSFDPDQDVLGFLGLAPKIQALERILSGSGDEQDLLVLDDDWEVQERLEGLLAQWRLGHIEPDRKVVSLSGGEQHRLQLAALSLQTVDAFLLDEPSNHLDAPSREALLQWMEQSKQAFVVVSHDRDLLARVDQILELSPRGARVFGGNIDFYLESIEEEKLRLEERYQESLKELRKARKQEIKTLEKQQKRSVRGAKQKKAAGTPKVLLNKLKGQSEASSSALKKKHQDKVFARQTALQEAREARDYQYDWKIDPGQLPAPLGSFVVEGKDLQFAWGEQPLWQKPVSLHLSMGERLHLAGENGTGKSTLMRLLNGELSPASGQVRLADVEVFWLDQHLAFLDDQKSIMENFEAHFKAIPPEHERRIRLGRFRFEGEEVFRQVSQLSGGERMRLALACVLATDGLPGLVLLDEPTNHLDMSSRQIFAEYLASYPGAMIVVSHDPWLIQSLELEKTMLMEGFVPEVEEDHSS